MKINSNQHRRTKILKEKNDVISLKSELEIWYNDANISNSHNEHQSKLAHSTKYNTNLKAYLNKKRKKKRFCVVFFVLCFFVFLCCVVFFRVVHVIPACCVNVLYACCINVLYEIAVNAIRIYVPLFVTLTFSDLLFLNHSLFIQTFSIWWDD